MNEGRELDALVAEKVMGMVLAEPCPSYPIHVVRIGAAPTYKCVDCAWVGMTCDTDHKPVPYQYSTDIAAAWEVVERIRDHFRHRVDVSACNSDKYQVCIALAPYPNCADAFEPTAPFAICLAALKAIGVEVPE